MNALCLVKQVPDAPEVPIGDDLTLRRDLVAQALNLADASAVELALRRKETLGGRVTAVTMGPERAEGMLRDLIARGVDEAALLNGPAFAGADTLATARALAAAARVLGPFDLLLFGRRASDGETGQVGPMVAALLDVPCVVNATCAQCDETHLRARQLTENGSILWQARLPAVLTLCEWSYSLRLASLRGLKAARSASIPRLRPEDIGLDCSLCGLAGSPTRVIRLRAPDKGARQTKWIAPEQMDSFLREVIASKP